MAVSEFASLAGLWGCGIYAIGGDLLCCGAGSQHFSGGVVGPSPIGLGSGVFRRRGLGDQDRHGY